MDNRKSGVSPAEAVLLGALAPGVNVSIAFCFLSQLLYLAVKLHNCFSLAFSSSDSALVLHVGFLVLIAATLFFLLSW
ncbi:unnamed protein product [Linum tenue]|uniref:Uncharacterized protein n=1 Tax=Linum tenue TaxID=586396 RepID=A0AAV0JF29_9ROSI|nr:unnamed protein product [Linum tenue]